MTTLLKGMALHSDMGEKECCGGECGCNHDHKHSVDEIAYNNHVLNQSLIALLIDKGVLKEEELQKKIHELFGQQQEPEEEGKNESEDENSSA